jgi:hypothetical protein
LNESLRAAYLDAMGVTVYLPRFDDLGQPLVHSKVVMTPRCGDVIKLPAQAALTVASDTTSVDQAAISETLVTPAKPSNALDVLVEVPNDAPSAISSVQPVDQVTAEPDNETGDDPDTKFSALIMYHSSGIALVDICRHDLGHQRAHSELGAAIIRALCKDFPVESNQFSWPVVNMPRMDRRLSKARISSQAFLSAFSQRCPISLLVSLGDDDNVFALDSLETRRLDFSLSDLLQGRYSKRDAWQALKDFCVL